MLVATSLTGGLRIRSEASTESKILKNVGEGTKLDVVIGEETEGAEWIHVQYAEEKTGYVSAEYVSVEFELGEAMTMDEIKSNGTIARYLAGPKASCMQAAQEAINGYTTVGSFTHFKRAGYDAGPNSIVIGSHVFY